MTLEGSLRELPLLDVLQLISVAGRTGVFTIEAGARQGRIVLRDGGIVDVLAEGLSGADALVDLALWDDGDFFFEPGLASPAEKAAKPATAFLAESSRQLERYRSLLEQLGSTAAVPVFSEDEPPTPFRLTPLEWRVVRNIGQQRTVLEIAGTSGATLFDTCQSLVNLISAGLVQLELEPQRHEESAAVSASDRTQPARRAELVPAATPAPV